MLILHLAHMQKWQFSAAKYAKISVFFGLKKAGEQKIIPKITYVEKKENVAH